MIIRLISIAALAALLLTACNESPTDTAKDVTQAREKASQDISEARQDANKTETQSVEKVTDAQQAYAKTDAKGREKLTKVQSDAIAAEAQADFNLAKTEAEGFHKIAVEKCGGLQGADKTACVSTADANLAAEVAAATADRDTTMAQLADSNR